MKAAARRLASVKPSQFLEVGAPTGLTGLLTHASPRSTLLYHYHSTLDKLKQVPESSVYRQSTEALTKHRLRIMEACKPQGWDEWQAKTSRLVSQDPTAFDLANTSAGQTVVMVQKRAVDARATAAAWDGEAPQKFPEGIRSSKERTPYLKKMKGHARYTPERAIADVQLEAEPQYTAEAISELERQLGAGLLEEVIAVAEGEHKLVESMVEAKVWEPLEERAPEGQWSYFERATHTGTT